MPLPIALARAPEMVLPAPFGVGGSGSRNGLALDEASTCVELDPACCTFWASSSALRFLAVWLCFSLRAMFFATSGQFLS